MAHDEQWLTPRLHRQRWGPDARRDGIPLWLGWIQAPAMW